MKKLLMGFFGFSAVLTIGSFTESFTSQADHGRPPAPAYEYGDIYIDHGEHI
ncbi:hypothetical protein VSY18_10890 [Bacillus albus]|uniref:hypothetical protein n=1 Tax=Bacillus cereus group TaxID=86661 RepID=UPI0022E477FF|nr:MULTISPECIES: hypothetical protein [Bacillus cereus group]MDA2028768.1 hypothetical protein [Bacillus cereus group sp. Bcc03]MDA2262847.1 hypothetical protein [Bacillus cereus group sp. Bc200]MDA2322427.1 hypothetical protein [Bacillus cereus group sp. Bc177]MDA2711790.1 hypothetical protein [Bacillus cereus group sp. Bc025]HDR7717952.1 hypothetical protein [Bacillus albus]